MRSIHPLQQTAAASLVSKSSLSLSAAAAAERSRSAAERRPVGTHIDCFFPHAVERTLEAVRARLDAAVSKLGDELAAIRNRGRFSAAGEGWSLWEDEGTITGEGPSGLSISVYPAVAEFTSVERFGAVERPDQGIHTALRRVFEAVAAGFGAGGRLAVAAGGFGDTDRAGDLALAGAGFAEVCECLESAIGPPARSWEALEAGAGSWYLIAPDAEPGATADRGGM